MDENLVNNDTGDMVTFHKKLSRDIMKDCLGISLHANVNKFEDLLTNL